MPYVTSTLGSYTTGTVAVVNGSTAVTGSGTLWSQIVCEGDILTLDDSKLYFVSSVNSDTSLTLDKPYASSSASGQSYRIILNTAAHFPSDVAAKVERALSDLPAVTLASLPGVKVYSATEDYSVGDVVLFSGKIYVCIRVNGPSSTVKNPGADTAGTYWTAVVTMSQVSSTGGAGKIPITTNEGILPLSILCESGTFTPLLYGLATEGEFSYTTQIGRFYKYGNLVFVYISIQGTCISQADGQVAIKGLPFVTSDVCAVNVAGASGGTSNAFRPLVQCVPYQSSLIFLKITSSFWVHRAYFSDSTNESFHVQMVPGNAFSVSCGGVYRTNQ